MAQCFLVGIAGSLMIAAGGAAMIGLMSGGRIQV